jgi:para-nitrobenzyl esterase
VQAEQILTIAAYSLYLNVFRPNTSSSNLPVLYWIYGGANLAGGANDPIYDGAKFAAADDAVVVTANYRLGMLGFLYEPALHTGSNTAQDDSGNFTTLDLVKGLNWVNRNITTFGGNSSNITIGGQSAGCIDTWGLIQTPLAAGKFQKAICLSGIPNMYPTVLGQGFAHQMEDGLVNPGHFLDGTVLPSVLGVPGILRCSYNRVPMIVGSVNTEGSLFVGLGGGWQVTPQTLWSMMNAGTPAASDSAIVAPAWQPAPGRPFASGGYAQTSRALSDLVVFLTDQIDRYLQGQVLCRPSPLYRYQFQWANEPQPWQDIYGTEHALDVPFVFDNFTLPSFLGYAFTPTNQTDREDLSKLLNGYFANFLWNGDPNDSRNAPRPYSGAPYWNAWTDLIGFNKRMMLNASLGKADAGRSSFMSRDEELTATTDILSLPPVGYAYASAFLKSFVPQAWLTELGLSVP